MAVGTICNLINALLHYVLLFHAKLGIKQVSCPLWGIYFYFFFLADLKPNSRPPRGVQWAASHLEVGNSGRGAASLTQLGESAHW